MPPAAAPSPWAAVPSFLQGRPGREARLVPVARAALLDPTLFQGVCWHLGSGRARMPMGLLGSVAGWPLSNCDGVGAVPTGGWSPLPPTSLLPSPRLLLVGWSSHGWGGDAATSCPTSALPLTLLSLGFIPGSWKQQRVGRAGAGPPQQPRVGGNPHPPQRRGSTMQSPCCHRAPPLSVCEKSCNPSRENSTRRKEKGIERRGCCGRRPA